MGVPILILGESGSGKSSSLRNFEPDEVGIFNVASKPLPFRKSLKKVDRAGYKTIIKALSKPSLKRYVIDDSQYLLVFEAFDKAKEVGDIGIPCFLVDDKDLYVMLPENLDVFR